MSLLYEPCVRNKVNRRVELGLAFNGAINANSIAFGKDSGKKAIVSNKCTKSCNAQRSTFRNINKTRQS